MKGKIANQVVPGILIICQFSICLASERTDTNDPNRYLNAVREFADNVLKYGRDTYGPKQTPLFVDGLNVNTHEPVKWINPDGYKWVLSNFASQQTLLRTLDGLSTITGDPKYREAAMQATKYAFENLQAPNGLLYWGHLAAYDAQRDLAFGNAHCLKLHYPYYELMWQVDPVATKRFIEAYWSTHILDWSNLDMNRISYYRQMPLEELWSHEYKGGPTPFQGKGSAFFHTGTSLIHAATIYQRLSHNELPVVWSKRLLRRYVDAAHPNTGISAFVYNSSWGNQLGGDLKDHFNDPRTTLFPYNPFEDRLLYWPENTAAQPWITMFLVGDLLGEEGDEFNQCALKELTAWGKASYREKDNSFIPILTDGSSIEGYVCKENGLARKGNVVKPYFVDLTFFWVYALACRTTNDEFMWQMVRHIAFGNKLGDIGEASSQTPKPRIDTNCSDVYGLLGFLELYRKTKRPEFLEMARHIGDNIVDNRFYRGFFVPTNKHIYTRFDCLEPLALLHLDAVTKDIIKSIPTVWPSSPMFDPPYRYKEEGVDRRTIYGLTESSEPPLSFQEAAAAGNIELVKSLIEKGADIDGAEDTFFKTALHSAAIYGHKDVAEYLLAKGASIDVIDGWSSTSLLYAVEKGHKEIVELLISKGAGVNIKNFFGNTPLHVAVVTGQEAIVELLVTKGADLNVKNNDGFVPLHYAVSRVPLSWWETQVGDSGTPNDLAIAQYLLDHGADVNVKSNDGRSSMDIARGENRTEMVELLLEKGTDVSIHTAASFGNVDKVRSYLEKGIDVNARDENGATPLHLAKNKGVAELLISKGADVNARNKNGLTPLHLVANKDVAELFLAKGADIHAKDSRGFTPFHYALFYSRIDIAKLFIASGVDINEKNNFGFAPLHYVSMMGKQELAELILAKGADINVKDNDGLTPLHFAASSAYKELSELLINKGADINAKSNDSETPLDAAVSINANPVVDLLIAKGAVASNLNVAAYRGDLDKIKAALKDGVSVNSKNSQGENLLYSAALEGHKDIVEFLIIKGADVNSKNLQNETALHAAVTGSHGDITELLIAKGADVNAQDINGKTALSLAEEKGNKEIAELLRKHGEKEEEKTPESTYKNVVIKDTDKPYVVLEHRGVRAVIVSNEPVDDEVLPGHRGGYSGVASLTHRQKGKNLFVPFYAGLNFEHIHDGTSQPRDILFEPRRAPMQIKRIDEYTAELYQPPTPNWQLESRLRYQLLDDGAIEMTLECIPRARTFKNDYIGLFFASYIDKPESLDIHFLGRPADQMDAEARWLRGVTPEHGKFPTHLAVDDNRNFAHDPNFPLTLVFNKSNYRYTEPWYYGVSGGMAFVLMFRPDDNVRFSQSPSGGGDGNPAWDFQWFVPQYEVGRRYRFVMRAMYLPFESTEQIFWATAPHRAALK